MGKKEEREAFRQQAMRMARYRLRRAMKLCGYSATEIREAEIEGEDRMVELIMIKYDEGAIDISGLEKEGASPPQQKAAKEETVKRTAKKAAKKEEEEEEEDPYADAWEDEDVEVSTSKEDKEEEESVSVENDEVDEPPPKAKRSAKRSEPSGDLGAIEVKLDKCVDLIVTAMGVISDLNDTVNKFIGEAVVFEEIVKLALSRIWKLGAAEPLKPGFGDVVSKAEGIAAERLGKKQE